MNKSDLLTEALQKWGTESQFDMVIEECAELQKAIIKLRRGIGSLREVAEETIDVGIMLEQIKIIIADNVLFDRIEYRKLDRLQHLLKKEKNRSINKNVHMSALS